MTGHHYHRGTIMKDGIYLILAGVGCSVMAWALWHFLGSEALPLFTILALMATMADNVRLRRKLREVAKDGRGGSPPPKA
jgi:hypothetical protein